MFQTTHPLTRSVATPTRSVALVVAVTVPAVEEVAR
jgi:hypothetical protein